MDSISRSWIENMKDLTVSCAILRVICILLRTVLNDQMILNKYYDTDKPQSTMNHLLRLHCFLCLSLSWPLNKRFE